MLMTVVERLLDWPFLGAVLILVLFFALRGQIRALIDRRSIKIRYGETEIEVNDLPESIDQDFAPVRDKVEELEELVARIVARYPIQDEAVADTSRQPEAPSPDSTAAARMLRELAGGDFKWRTLERLGLRAGVSEEDAHRILLSNPSVKFGRAKRSGKRIVSLVD